jgi:CBS domain containing-hemolysin-like protein
MSMMREFFNFFKVDKPEETDEIYAQDIMLHRIKCKFLYLGDTRKEIQETFCESSITTLPICRENTDDIVGCYSIKGYLKDQESQESFVSRQNVVFIPTKTNLKTVVDYLYSKRFGLLVVVDGYGGTQGVITEEILWQAVHKEIFGHESFIPVEGSFVLNGENLFEDIKEFIVIKEFEQMKSLTIGGLIIEYMSGIPQTGDVITIGNYEIKIIDSNPTTIKKLSITPLKKQ